MSGAKRRINSTGRKKIGRECFDISMADPVPGDPLRAKVELYLGRAGFPHNAPVIVEAYHRSSGMRFDCGTVANLAVPPVLDLTDVDQGGGVLFRIKVLDPDAASGRIIGSAERIQPRNEGEDDTRRSLFPLRTRDLGEEVWRVDVADDMPPSLVLNNRLPGFSQNVQDDPLLQGVLLPAALRIVLREIAAEPVPDEGSWKADWLEYCRDSLDAEDPASIETEEDRELWIDSAVEKFCKQGSFIGRIRDRAEDDR
ncbi:hypothetical protein OCH239_18660 [Roseivivax halodurans JCM 10272]|uniref:Uncharacterized protein n=1 Tax=Roseivivax halodurans JCM 10272 TaxID=1449350 RepID=X7E853_9RHOB|nr:hypothetical protein [Roseivivax halodurans]ETX12015.1 hypothetical protein OCH239_18660 [Roseivivax halodurans JCM 10272]